MSGLFCWRKSDFVFLVPDSGFRVSVFGFRFRVVCCVFSIRISESLLDLREPLAEFES